MCAKHRKKSEKLEKLSTRERIKENTDLPQILWQPDFTNTTENTLKILAEPIKQCQLKKIEKEMVSILMLFIQEDHSLGHTDLQLTFKNTDSFPEIQKKYKRNTPKYKRNCQWQLEEIWKFTGVLCKHLQRGSPLEEMTPICDFTNTTCGANSRP